MKKIIYLMVSIALTSISLLQCKKKDISDCGCNSPAIQNINKWKGYLFFNTSQKKYEIQIGVPGLLSDYFICDTSFSQFQSLIDTNRHITYPVIFSGDVNKFCVPDTIVGYFNNVYNIQLTNIKKQ